MGWQRQSRVHSKSAQLRQGKPRRTLDAPGLDQDKQPPTPPPPRPSRVEAGSSSTGSLRVSGGLTELEPLSVHTVLALHIRARRQACGVCKSAIVPVAQSRSEAHRWYDRDSLNVMISCFLMSITHDHRGFMICLHSVSLGQD